MKTPSEKEIVKDIKQLLSLYASRYKMDWFRINTNGTLRNGILTPNRDTAGFSDFIVLLYNALPLFIEAKSERGAISPLQIEFKERVEALGYKYHLVRSAIEVERILNSLNLEWVSRK